MSSSAETSKGRSTLSPPSAPPPTPAAAASRRRPGTSEGEAIHTGSIVGCSEPRGDHPGVHVVLDEPDAKVVVFEFAAGGELKEHAAHHATIIQVVRGSVMFRLPERSVELRQGELLHLTPQLRHAVTAHEPTTLMVTMLLAHE